MAAGGKRKSGEIMFVSDTLTPTLKVLGSTFNKRLQIFMDYQATKVQDYMRTNAPWTDRTSNARNGLFAKEVNDGSVFSVVCYHSVPYGIWLEVRHEGRFSIIVPTIQREGIRIMGELGKLLEVA